MQELRHAECLARADFRAWNILFTLLPDVLEAHRDRAAQTRRIAAEAAAGPLDDAMERRWLGPATGRQR
jgi:hypothetical protein